MAGFIPVTNTAEVSLQFSQADGEFAENVWGVVRDEAWDVASLTALAHTFMTWWHDGTGGASYREAQGTGVQLLGCAVRDLTTETSPSLVISPFPITEVHGIDTAAPLPNGVSFAITARTGHAGRSFRGRTFAIGLTESVLLSSDSNQIKPDVAAIFTVALGGLITAVHAADAHAQLAVVSRRHDNAPRSLGVATPIVNYGYHDLFLDYQRRRAPGHNRHH